MNNTSIPQNKYSQRWQQNLEASPLLFSNNVLKFLLTDLFDSINIKIWRWKKENMLILEGGTLFLSNALQNISTYLNKS